MPRLDTHLRLPQQTRDRIDAIVSRAREAGESFPANRTDAVVMAIDLLYASGTEAKPGGEAGSGRRHAAG